MESTERRRDDASASTRCHEHASRSWFVQLYHELRRLEPCLLTSIVYLSHAEVYDLGYKVAKMLQLRDGDLMPPCSRAAAPICAQVHVNRAYLIPS